MKDGKRLAGFLKRKASEVGGHVQESWERKRVGWITGAKQRKFEKQELKQIEKQAYQEARIGYVKKEARRRGIAKAKQHARRGGGFFGAVGKFGDYGAGVMKNVEESGMLVNMGSGKRGSRGSSDPLGLYSSPQRVVHRRKKSKRKR